jgi:hypothetical protein
MKIEKRGDKMSNSNDIVNTSATSTGLASRDTKLKGLALRAKSIGKTTAGSSKIQLCFACDSTGSMYEVFSQAISSIKQILNEIKITKPEASFIAYKNHGDEEYFDNEKAFIASPWTENFSEIYALLSKIKSNGGGDGLTVLEDVLQYLVIHGGWKKDSKKILVIIGDMPPHGVIDSINKCPNGISYKEQVASLKDMGVTIYSVFCSTNDLSSTFSARKKKVYDFYKWIANETGGKCLSLEEMHEITVMLKAICIKESGQIKDYKDMRDMLLRIAKPALAERVLKMLE